MVLTSALLFFYFRDFMLSVWEWSEYQLQKKMSKSEVQRCMDWLFNQQGEMENASFGRGKFGVLQALANHHSKVKEITRFKRDIEDILRSEKADDKSVDQLNGVYESVKAFSDKRNSCLEVISKIVSLEDHIQVLSSEFDARAVYLVSSSDITKNKGGPTQTNESMARAAQTCILSVRENWRWVFQVMQCAEVHLRNAAAYQEFFQEADEAEYWMNTTLSRIHLSFDKSKLLGNRSDAESIIQEIKDVLAAYLQWQTKVDYLSEKGKHVVPVPFRIKPLSEPRPVIALTDFKSNEIDFIEGDTLTLLDNSDKKTWKVRTETGQVGNVPAVIILIPGPASEAVDVTVRLRLQLLSLWTSSVKRLGYQIIAFMLLVLRDWTEEEVTLLQAMAALDKRELLRILLFIEETLIKNWSNYRDFQELQERITRLRMILEETTDVNITLGGGKSENNNLSNTVIVQVKTLEDLLNRYKDFWTFWETFRCIVEMLRQPRFLLVCDKWEQLRFITSAHFVKFWDAQFDLSGNELTPTQTSSLVLKEGSSGGDLNQTQVSSIVLHTTTTTGDHELVQAEESTVLQSEALVNSEVTIQEQKEETTTDTVTSTLEEEQHTFIIKGVLDPRDDRTQLTLQQAIMLGIVDETQKFYVNPNTGKAMSMTDAMNEGRVLMEFVSRRKIREEQNSYGLITIKITKETKPYTITGVIDPVTDETLSVSQAVSKNILDAAFTIYKTEKGEQISVADAIHSGLVHVEYHEGDTDHPPEVVTKTYAVHGVVDQKKKQKVSFSDAVRDGLLDRDSGEYINNITGDHVGVHEAIVKGFIKARVVTDPSKLEINPENTIVVEKLSSAREKLLKSVKAIKAFTNANN